MGEHGSASVIKSKGGLRGRGGFEVGGPGADTSFAKLAHVRSNFQHHEA